MDSERRIAVKTVLMRQETSRDWATRLLAQITLTLLGLGSMLFAVTVFYPFNPITKLELRVVNAPAVGGSIVVEVDYCKAREWVPDEVRWSLNNDVTVILPVATASLPSGCNVRRVYLPLPQHIAIGNYKLQEEVVYSPWPWRSFTYVVQSPMFRLYPATGGNE
jgi:hypothetical protein